MHSRKGEETMPISCSLVETKIQSPLPWPNIGSKFWDSVRACHTNDYSIELAVLALYNAKLIFT
jgi:hypothetical protein